MREMAIGNIITMAVLWVIIITLLMLGYTTLVLGFFLFCNAVMTVLSATAAYHLLRAPKAIA